MIRTLQSLRLIFILLVLFSHLSWGDVPPPRFGGECGVSLFFMLSGFVLSIGYGAKIEEGRFSLKTFYLKQLAKCYPLHLLTLLLQNSWLTRGGGLSLEVYMTHILVIRGVTGVLVGAGIDLGYAATALACVAMTLVTALATKKYFVDKLYLALKKHVIKP